MKTQIQKITLGAGCFWHVQHTFSKLKGIAKTTVGYMSYDENKSKEFPNPTYEQVCSDKTGYIEVCEIEFNPKEVSFDEILKVFWKIHNPTQLNRQGSDIGTQYKSAIFYYTPEQKNISEKSKSEIQKNFKNKITTEIIPAKKFFKAENYHQNYLEKKGMENCRI